MAVVRCPRGHFYDNIKFSSCPYCGVPLTGANPSQGNEMRTDFISDPPQNFDTDKTVAMNVPGGSSGNAEAGGHTVSLESMVSSPSDDEKTISIYSETKGNDYVTGWLVCVEGPEKGRDYRLHHGFNRLGRNFGMDIQVMDDPAISRDTHCSVVYDDHSNSFFAVPGTGTLTYMGEELLSDAAVLTAGDRLKIGNSVFEFIPFCREGMVWEK